MTDTMNAPAGLTVPADAATPWVRLCRWAAAAMVPWAVAVTAFAGVIVPPVVVIGMIFGVLAVFLAPHRRRLAIATGVLALLAVLGNLPGLVDELGHPTSGVAFWLTLLSTVAALTTTVAGAGALARWRSSLIRPVLATAVVVLAAGAGVAGVATAGIDGVPPRPGDVEVVASGNTFDVDRVTVDAGTTGFWLDNRDPIRHTLTLVGTDAEVHAPGYSAQRGDFELGAGEYVLYCAVPGHEAMRIDVTVTP